MSRTPSQHLARPPNAARFIVTVYGDLCEPRGRVLGMGTLIDICAQVGLSESLVRTAVSRLVSAGQLSGERKGRRSFYRLTPTAAKDFQTAGRIIFGGNKPADDFVLAEVADTGKRAELLRHGYARFAGDFLIAAAQNAYLARGYRTFTLAPAEGSLKGWADRYWPLADWAAKYRAFQQEFRNGGPGSGTALAQRLLLVHDFRLILLAEPRLPACALPSDWPGHGARRLFAQRYLALSSQCAAEIDGLRTQDVPLVEDTNAVHDRERWLTRDAP